MDSIFYVYKLIDSETNIPFYIGKGHGNRMYSHENEVKRNVIPHNNLHLFFKIKKILLTGKFIIYKKIKENITEKEAFLLEKLEIKECKDELCNLTPGGDGSKGYRWREDQKIKKKIQNTGKNNPMYGKFHTEKAKKIMSEKRKSREWNFKHSDEHKNKLKEYNPGAIATSKKVIQFDNNEEIICIWPSLSSAAKFIKSSKGNLLTSIKNNWKCKGYKWKYE